MKDLDKWIDEVAEEIYMNIWADDNDDTNLHETMWEAIDGSEYVIYTREAERVVCDASLDDLEAAYQNLETKPDTYQDLMTSLAFYLLLERLTAAISTRLEA